jgi:hypothetical protein
MDYLLTPEPPREKLTLPDFRTPEDIRKEKKIAFPTHTFHEEVKFSGTTSHVEDPGGLTKVRKSRADNKVNLTRYIYPFQPSNQGCRNSNVLCLVYISTHLKSNRII